MSESSFERLYFSENGTRRDTWWNRYDSTLTQMTSTARTALKVDSTYIVERGIFGRDESDNVQARSRAAYTGLVMGSVQSGKTASMFGVAALSLDRGVDIVIILAGTRLSLWRQTHERLISQLDVGDDGVQKQTRRLLCPAPGIFLANASASLGETYRLSSAQARRMFTQRRPLIITAMKQTDHLYALGSSLRRSVFGAVQNLDRPVSMLVLDDEADDGSVLDSAVEAGQDPLSSSIKQIPRAVADLWDPRSGGAPDNLRTVYIAYTATPQANLLQEDHNPLAPRDFVISLRTPLDVGEPIDPARLDAVRTSTYPEAAGLDFFYTGGEVFYNRGLTAKLSVELSALPNDDLGEAIRAYLVAGAIRLHRSPNHAGPGTLMSALFDTRLDAKAASPDPHSMLFHPSADIGQHFVGAEDILMWAGVSDRTAARQMIDSGSAYFPAKLMQRVSDEEELWKSWLDRFQYSALKIAAEFNTLAVPSIPEWPIIKKILETQIIPATRVAVVNSDLAADDRPEYSPWFDNEKAKWRTSRDLCTIFVSGNVMARGLTLEGLTTVLFRRGSNSPRADTQMQMQRWFGYRGKYLELCRLFASRQQINLFAAYHDLDEGLRDGITARMAGNAPSPVVLHGMGFLATGKIANIGRVPLCWSSRPFITLINDGKRPDPNATVVAELFKSTTSSEVRVSQTLRGRALDKSLSLTQAADLLDKLRFAAYSPGRASQLGDLWAQVEARLSATIPLSADTRLYCPPESSSGVSSPTRLNCPYAIPAYLRLWHACLSRSVRGLFVTGSPTDRWSMANLNIKQETQPRFTVGIRFGAGLPVSVGPLATLDFSIPATQKRVGLSGELETTWGANDPGAGSQSYRGDEYFDYYHRAEPLPVLSSSAPWRPPGSYGQILFYVNQNPSDQYPAVAVGICIPGGGPEQFAATRAGWLSATT